MGFGQIPGHTSLKKSLIDNVINNKVSHAQLFLGPEGSGNLDIAIAFSKYILCNSPQEDSCGDCPSCIKVSKLIHPDLHFIFPNATTKSVSSNPNSRLLMNDWREFLGSQKFPNQNDWVKHMDFGNKQLTINKTDCQNILKAVHLKSFEGNYKIFIIWLPEKLNYAAAPKLLKVIEEPPEKTLFLFVSHSKEEILPTILSRLQNVQIGRLKDVEVLDYLLSQNTGEKRSKMIARNSEGNLRKATELLSQNDSEESFTYFFSWMRICFSVHRDDNIVKVFEWIDIFSKMGREVQKNFLQTTMNILRTCIQYNYNDQFTLEGYLNEEQKTIRKFAPFINNANLLSFVSEIEQSIRNIERNGNPKILMLNLSLKFAKIIRLK